MLRLEQKDWKAFFLNEIFEEIQRGKRLKKDNHLPGEIPYISSSASNNAVDAFIGNKKNVRTFKNCLSLANSGSVGFCAFHPYTFIASDHITQLRNSSFNKYVYLFISVLCSRLSAKYNFNREINDSRICREKVLLPINDSGQPDYKFMEDYMRQKEKMLLARLKHNQSSCKTKVDELASHNWKNFFIDDIFTISPGKRLVAKDMTEGRRPFIGATDSGNGITNFVSDSNESLDSNVLGVNYDGNGMVISFYHPYECIFTDSVKRFHLKHHDDNKYILLFMKIVILQQKAKYNYGYKFNATRMARQIISLPVTDEGKPDYQYMEQYVKSLFAKKLNQYIEFTKKY